MNDLKYLIIDVLDPSTTNCQLYTNHQLPTSTEGWDQDVFFFKSTEALNISFSLSDTKGQRPKGVAWPSICGSCEWRVISTCKLHP